MLVAISPGPLCARSDAHDAGASGSHIYESRHGSCTNLSEVFDTEDGRRT